MDSEVQNVYAARILNQYVMKGMALKAISYYEGNTSMKEMEECIAMGQQVGNAINNLGTGNFSSLPNLNPPLSRKKTVVGMAMDANSEVAQTTNKAIEEQAAQFKRVLDAKNSQITKMYTGLEEMRATIDTQVNLINTQFEKISTMIHSYQDDMYKSFTET